MVRAVIVTIVAALFLTRFSTSGPSSSRLSKLSVLFELYRALNKNC